MQRPTGIQRHPSLPHIHTDRYTDTHLGDEETHTHSVRGTEGVTWAWPWQRLSSLTVSLAPWRSLSTNPQKKLFLAHLQAPPRNQSRRGKGRAEQRREETFASPKCPQSAPAPGNNFRSSSLAQQPWQRVPGLKSGEGLVVRRSMAQCVPRGSGIGGGSQVRRSGAGQSCSVSSGWDPTGFCMSQKPGHGDRWLLSQTWTWCHQVTLSPGVPWLSVGSGRHL